MTFVVGIFSLSLFTLLKKGEELQIDANERQVIGRDVILKDSEHRALCILWDCGVVPWEESVDSGFVPD